MRFNSYAYKRPFTHCPYFICERRFYVRTYASENYATMEINPKGRSPIFVRIFLDATFTPWHKLRRHKQRFWPWKTVSSHLKFTFQQSQPRSELLIGHDKKWKKLPEKNWDAKYKKKRCNYETPKVPKISSDYLDILFDYFLFLNSGSARVLLTNCYLI